MSGSLLTQIELAKKQFGQAAGDALVKRLKKAQDTRWRRPEELIRLHEVLLFLRAYPQTQAVLRLTDEILFAFGRRLKGIPKEEFEYADVSGIAKTGLSTNFSHPFARSLALRHGNSIQIDWAKYDHPERLAKTLAKLLPEAFEDWAIGKHADWRRRYDQAGGTLEWLTANVDPDVYDLLDLPVRWELGDSPASRSRARIPRTKIFYHDAPLLTRKDLSLSGEFNQRQIDVSKLTHRKAQQILAVIIDASAVRYRELYGFEYPDEKNVWHADLGRGMDIFFCGVSRKWKLPNREYAAGMYFRNGVPLGYVEVIWSGERMEVGFNLYYTFRQGETAWLYLRLLKLFHQQYGVTSFVIDPYQLGHENEEAIESGSFWFYYKLGFRPESRLIRAQAEREIQKMAQETIYRTSPATLRRLAKGNMILRVV